MIAKPEMMQVLLDACPPFSEKWEEFRCEWADEPELPLYLAHAGFARHLVGLLECRDSGGLEAAFGAIERLHIEGDLYVREAATIGLLEGLQNGNLHRKTNPLEFEPYLQPESRRWWDKLNRFWDGDAAALRNTDGAT